MAMLEINALSVRYGPIEAVKNVSFSIERGEIVSLIGRNGAGKTTTLNAISGVLPVAGGEVASDGRKLSGLKPHQIVELGIAQVPEGRRVFPRLTVWENLELGAYIRPKDREVPADRDRLLQLFPILAERREQLAGTLSGGEQQMLAIARALMCRPRLLMLDEPSMGLAPLVGDKILNTLRQINQAGVTILLVEQNVKAALRLSSRAYVIEAGIVALSGPSEMLLADERVKKTYLGEDD
jgi:branched-chain amino acid transport system ATP-binding protein